MALAALVRQPQPQAGGRRPTSKPRSLSPHSAPLRLTSPCCCTPHQVSRQQHPTASCGTCAGLGLASPGGAGSACPLGTAGAHGTSGRTPESSPPPAADLGNLRSQQPQCPTTPQWHHWQDTAAPRTMELEHLRSCCPPMSLSPMPACLSQLLTPHKPQGGQTKHLA